MTGKYPCRVGGREIPMSRSVLVFILLLTAGAIGGFALALRPVDPPVPQAAAASPRFVLATEQQWIVADVVGSMVRITQSGGPSLVNVTTTSDAAFRLGVPGLERPVPIGV